MLLGARQSVLQQLSITTGATCTTYQCSKQVAELREMHTPSAEDVMNTHIQCDVKPKTYYTGKGTTTAVQCIISVDFPVFPVSSIRPDIRACDNALQNNDLNALKPVDLEIEHTCLEQLDLVMKLLGLIIAQIEFPQLTPMLQFLVQQLHTAGANLISL